MLRRLWSLLMFAALCARAQQVEVTRFDVADGLPQSMVNHVLQDRDGFIWLGTGDGLARFDGQRFVVCKHDPRDSSSLSHNSIWGLAERHDGRLWVGTRAGLDLLDRYSRACTPMGTGVEGPLNGCWRTVHHTPGLDVFYSPLVGDLLRIQDGRPRRQHIPHGSSYAWSFAAATGSFTQLMGDDTLLTVHPDGTEEIAVLPTHGTQHFTGLLPWGDGWLVLSHTECFLWNRSSGRRELPPAVQAYASRSIGNRMAAVDGNGKLWLGLSNVGVLVLDRDLRIEQVHPLLPADERPLEITCITFDRQGNTWVGTDGKGVFRIAPQVVKFGRCMPGQGLPWEPRSWFVRGFAQWDDDRVLVVLFQGGLALFDERDGSLTPLHLAPRAQALVDRLALRRPFNDVHGLIWMQDNTTVLAVDPRSGDIAFVRERPWLISVAPGADGDAVLVDKEDAYAMRVVDGRPVPEPLGMTPLRDYIERIGMVPQSVAVAPDGSLLLSASTAPLARCTEKDVRTFEGIDHTVRMNAWVRDGERAAWLATNEGLYRVELPVFRIVKHWTIEHGLPDQFIYGVLPAGDGRWWLTTNNGLGLFDPVKGTCLPFGTADGLQSREFNSNAFFRSRRGRVYVGGVNGFNHFDGGAPSSDPDPARVVPVRLLLQDSVVPLTGPGPVHVELPYGRNALHIELAVLEMSAPERARYRYRIAGYRDWTERPAGVPIDLVNLPDGDHVIEVIGVNADGVVSPAARIVTVHVPLPFWASPWASALGGSLLVLLVGGVVFLLYRHRVRIKLERAEAQVKELRIRARVAQDLHDDLGSGLAGISALAQRAEQRARSGEPPVNEVERLQGLSRELMKGLRDVVWANDPTGGTVAGLLLRIRDQTADLCAGSGAQLVVQFPDPLPERPVGSRAKRDLYLIAKEATHNAFKYSGATTLTIGCSMGPDRFTLWIQDNGKGLPERIGAGGHGLRNMRERSAEIGCDLTVQTLAGGGTRVHLAGPPASLDL